MGEWDTPESGSHMINMDSFIHPAEKRQKSIAGMWAAGVMQTGKRMWLSGEINERCWEQHSGAFFSACAEQNNGPLFADQVLPSKGHRSPLISSNRGDKRGLVLS